ncbi:MAG TPA: AbrB/MazE/SpoVT family DNA-binding domain-containing protein [Verrucomicrobiae bacterium]|nr:AbrB/MazE/SpoVT family DNA-binding domain-containing protein [Verrucomicrobiae bacterium]
MKTLVQRWGNSLAVRIPKTFAEEISVREGDEVEMNVTKGRLVVAPRPPRDYHLADLVAGIRRGNLHKEVITGPSQGNEVW